MPFKILTLSLLSWLDDKRNVDFGVSNGIKSLLETTQNNLLLHESRDSKYVIGLIIV